MSRQLKILVISWSYPPIKSPRAIKAEAITETLLEMGHHVHLITRGDPRTFPQETRENLSSLTLMPLSEWPVFPMLRVNAPVFSKDWIARKLNGLLYKIFCYPGVQALFSTMLAIKKLKEEGFDLCLSVDGPQPMHWAVAWSRGRKLKEVSVWIADNGDPLTRGLPGNTVARYFRKVENWFAEKADVLTVPVPQGNAYFDSRHAEKIHVVKHSLKFPSKTEQSSGDRPAGQTCFAYAGNLAPYRSIADGLFAFLAKKKGVQFHLFGPNQQIAMESLARSPGLEDVLIDHGNIERMELLEQLGRYDFLIYFPYALGLQVPFKLIDYAYSSRPVLSFSGQEKDFSALEDFIAGDYEKAQEVTDYKEYSADKTCARYLKLYRDRLVPAQVEPPHEQH